MRNSENSIIRSKYNNNKYEGVDASGRSVCNIVPEEHIEHFPFGKVLNDIKFVINDELFSIPHFRVISIREVFSPDGKSTNHYKVVCLFHLIQKSLEHKIVKVVESFARKQVLDY